MTLLDNHLEQISLSSTAIAELPFPAPKIFTNALLHSHDITALIRDTESHERALFSFAPQDLDKTVPRRSTTHPSSSVSQTPFARIGLSRRPKNGSAAAVLLGRDLGEQIQRQGQEDARGRGEVDVEVLLKGAEKLCAIYPVPGATEQIASLRTRHSQLISSIARFESRVSKQTGRLAQMNRAKPLDSDEEEPDDSVPGGQAIRSTSQEQAQITAEDFVKEEEEIRELEKTKRALEDRVSGMERDLGGLLR